jgi:retinol dehydrogenase 12
LAAASEAKTAIVTGASAGIGLQTALGLARAGMRVVVVGRDASRIEAGRREIAQLVPEAEIGVMLADFASLDAVRALAAQLLAEYGRIDVLVNNAGLITPRYTRSADGYELILAVNHLAPFLLTNLLLDRLKASAPARIVTVASQAHRRARLDPATMAAPPDWTPVSAYGRSKLANILLTRTLAKRLDPNEIVACCLHPGVIATDIGNRAGMFAGLAWRLGKLFMASPEQGAATSLFLATTGDPKPFHGAYVIDQRAVQPDKAAHDDALGEALWHESARLVEL